jgi:hypothetical protein
MDADRYERATHDADFRARLEAAFGEAGGRGEALDELWWRERPGLPHPRGVRDPALERDALVEAAYSKAQSEQDARHDRAALRAFEAVRHRQAEALDRALVAALGAVVPPVGVRDVAPAAPAAAPAASGEAAGAGGEAAGAGAGAFPADPSGLSTPTPSSRPYSFVRRHRGSLTVAALIAALIAAGAVGALAAGTTSRAPTAPTETPSAEIAPAPSVLSQALARVQVPTDALPQALRGTITPPSSRLLYDDDPAASATKHRWRLWTGTGETPDQVCFLSSFDGVRNTVTCLPKASALTERIIVTDATTSGTFEALIVGGAVAVQIS